MSLFVQSKTVVPLYTDAGVVPGLNKTKVRLVIPRQSRRLQKIRIHARLNLTTATTIATAGTSPVGLAGIWKNVKLLVSDAAGSNRAAIDTNSATLHVLNRKWEQSIGRFTAAAVAPTHIICSQVDVFTTIPIRYPLLDDPIGYRTSMPMDENYAQADPVLELTPAAALTDLGFNAGAAAADFTICRATLYWDEINDAAMLKAGKPMAYVPQEFATRDLDVNAMNNWSIDRGGWLSGVLVEEFQDTARQFRGTALNTVASDNYNIKYGRSDLRQWYTNEGIEDDDSWSVSPAITPVAANQQGLGGDHGAVMVDFLAQRSQGSIYSGASMLNLYTDNAGDSANLSATAMAANGRLRVSTHKFMTPDTSVLFGG